MAKIKESWLTLIWWFRQKLERYECWGLGSWGWACYGFLMSCWSLRLSWWASLSLTVLRRSLGLVEGLGWVHGRVKCRVEWRLVVERRILISQKIKLEPKPGKNNYWNRTCGMVVGRCGGQSGGWFTGGYMAGRCGRGGGGYMGGGGGRGGRTPPMPHGWFMPLDDCRCPSRTVNNPALQRAYHMSFVFHPQPDWVARLL